MQNQSDSTVVSIRVFDATTAQMFDAWTNPDKLAKWWGPKGFSNTFNEFHPEPGGRWSFTMHGPNGTNYPNESVFIQVDAGQIILDHVNWPKFRLTATFEDLGNQTKLTFNQAFESPDDFEKIKAVVVPANEENFDRLEVVLK